MKDYKKNQKRTEQQDRPVCSSYTVFKPNLHQNLASTLDFEWPEFTTEKARIKAYSKRYKDVPLDEAFGVKLQHEYVEVLPTELTVGQVIPVVITKQNDDVIIEGIATKEMLVCKNNFKRYKNMQVSNVTVNAIVTGKDKTRSTVTIDILQQMYTEWVNKVLEDKTVQYDVKNPKVISVRNLKLSNGGFIGQAEVPVISEFIGEPYYTNAFIPGSQIVLNIENDFSQWNGKTVDTFVAGNVYRNGQLSLICSRKDLLMFSGSLAKIEWYNDYCLQGKKWSSLKKNTFSGIVTGVINSNKKCGVFVELPLFNITTLVNAEADKLVNYKANQDIAVRITDFEQMLEEDPNTGNTVHSEPYKIENGLLKSCILKPVFEFA